MAQKDMFYLFNGLDFYTAILLTLALFFVLFYEAINGFHDTANAVTTIIYTKALNRQTAVFIAGIFDFLGVILGGLSVAYAIVHLLPTDLLLNVGSTHNLIMIFSILMAAIIWNLSTWYFGLPASSSHTLIGAIIGVAITNALINKSSVIQALNIKNVINILLSLIFSPVIGFLISAIIIIILKYFFKKNNKYYQIHKTPIEYEKENKKKIPPLWIRIGLIISGIGVSFSHGANDGQKGIGLIMLVLISISPINFVININASSNDIHHTYISLMQLEKIYEKYKIKNCTFYDTKNNKSYKQNINTFYCNNPNILNKLQKALFIFNKTNTYLTLQSTERIQIRQLLIYLSDISLKMSNISEIEHQDATTLRIININLLKTIEYAPIWIIISIALALSIGTMIGWQRVAITIGEKIGKKDISYAQGLSAQITAAFSIGIASYTGIPVSTTQVLSSAVAGSIVADGHDIQIKTIKNILLAWLFTLPISVIMSGFFYWIIFKLV